MLDQKCWSFCIVYKNIYFCVYMSGSRRGDIGRSVLCNKVFASPMPFKTNRQIMNLSPWIPVLSLPWLGGVHVRAWKSVYVCVSFIWCVKQHADRMMERSLGIFFFTSKQEKKEKKRKCHMCAHTLSHPPTPSFLWIKILLPLSLPAHRVSSQNEEIVMKICHYSSSEIIIKQDRSLCLCL